MFLRLCGPLEPWFNKTWKPGDFEKSTEAQRKLCPRFRRSPHTQSPIERVEPPCQETRPDRVAEIVQHGLRQRKPQSINDLHDRIGIAAASC